MIPIGSHKIPMGIHLSRPGRDQNSETKFPETPCQKLSEGKDVFWFWFPGHDQKPKTFLVGGTKNQKKWSPADTKGNTKESVSIPASPSRSRGSGPKQTKIFGLVFGGGTKNQKKLVPTKNQNPALTGLARHCACPPLLILAGLCAAG